MANNAQATQAQATQANNNQTSISQQFLLKIKPYEYGKRSLPLETFNVKSAYLENNDILVPIEMGLYQDGVVALALRIIDDDISEYRLLTIGKVADTIKRLGFPTVELNLLGNKFGMNVSPINRILKNYSLVNGRLQRIQSVSLTSIEVRLRELLETL